MSTKFSLTKREIIKCIAVILAALLIIGSLIFLLYVIEKDDGGSGGGGGTGGGTGGGDKPNEELIEFLEYDGKKYVLRKDVETMLIMGLDKDERQETGKYYNQMCADFLLLLVFDHGNKTCSAIHVNRDTMAEINILGANGKVTGKTTKQITLAHTYGSGSHDSCINTRNAVSKLLCGIPINHYVSLTMDAVQEVNDMVGGVTLEVLDDMTRYDPALKKGETVTLMGEQALKYVRMRYYVDDSSNLSRMKRQRQYLGALYTKILDYSAANDNFTTELAFKISDYMVTNCSVGTFQTLLEKAETYERGEIHSFEGETKINYYLEFYPYEEDIKRTVIAMFCKVASI